MKRTETYIKGKVYHLDTIQHLSRFAMDNFRKPICKEEDPLYKGNGEPDDMSDMEVCIVSFRVTETITFI